MQSKRPNILLITSDQQRRDSLGCYHPGLSTPGVDSLARDGMVFDRAYTCHATCTPARASILTGLMGSHHGAYTIGTSLPEHIPTLAGILSHNGYCTALVGKPHFQQLSTPGTLEYSGASADEAFWRGYEGGYYGFEHTRIYNGHTSYRFTAGMHYRVWLKDKGVTDRQLEEWFNYKPSDSYREAGRWQLPREYHPSVFTSECSCEFLENAGPDRPFFLWASFSDPHDPHVTPAPYDTMFDPREVDYLGYLPGEHDQRPACYNQLYRGGVEALPFNDSFGVPSAPSALLFGDDDYFRRITALHHGMVKLMDEEIEKILNTLRRKGLYDDTLILFTTDHGDYLGNHGFVYKGFPAFEEVYNVPLVVKPPRECAQSRSDALFSHIDIAPTVLDYAGIPAGHAMDGVSQRCALEHNTAARTSLPIENRLVTEGFYQKMLVTQRYKLVMYQDSTEGELYDLQTDRDQYRNLWEDPAYSGVKLDLLRQLSGRDAQTPQQALEAIWQQMHAEEPVQIRTSYS